MNRTYNNIEKYKFICEEILNKIYIDNCIDLTKKYHEDIGLFCEDILGIKLKPYQKILLKLYGNINNSDIIPIARNGKSFLLYNYLYKMLLKDDNNKKLETLKWKDGEGNIYKVECENCNKNYATIVNKN